MTEWGDRDVGVVGGRDEASDHNFFFEGELAVRESLASVDADIAEAAAHFFVAAGVEDNVLAIAFPPECWAVGDVAVVGGEGCVDVVEGERGRLCKVTLPFGKLRDLGWGDRIVKWIPSRWSKMTH